MTERKTRYKKAKTRTIKNPITGRTRTTTKIGNRKTVTVKGKGRRVIKSKDTHHSIGHKKKVTGRKTVVTKRGKKWGKSAGRRVVRKK